MKTLLYITLFALSITTNAQTFSQKNDRFKGPWSTEYGDFGFANDYVKSINLNNFEDKEILENEVLSFTRSDQSRVIWGVGKTIDAVFDYEYLPIFFEREIAFDKIELDSGLLKWVFNGNEGGYTVQVSKDSIHLYQRYYNSFGFNKPVAVSEDGTYELIKNYRHPNEIWLVSATAYEGEIKTIKLKTDYAYQLVLEVNGKEIARQATIIDVFREQLQFTDGIKDVDGKLLKPEVKKVNITLADSKKHQSILGFGGIMSIPAYNELSEKGKQMWWDIMSEYNLLIQREYPVGQMLHENFDNWDNISDASPHYYGDNFPNGEISDFEFNKRIIDSGGMVTFSFWKLPQFMINEDGTVNTSKYTEGIVNYCKTLKRKSGAYPKYVGVQNEIFKSKEEWHRMTIALRKALDENDLQDIEIMMFNSPFLHAGIKAAIDFKEDEKVWNMIDYAASNMYDYNSIMRHPHDYDSLMHEMKKVIGDKPFISSELAVNWNDYHAHSYRTAFSMAMLYHKNLSILDAVSLQYCWTLLNSPQEAFDMTRTLLAVDEKNGFIPYEQGYMLRTFGAYSRHLPKGAIRIETQSDKEDILTTAYNTEKGKVVVILNQGTAPYKIELSEDFNKMEIASWCMQNEKKEIPEEIIIKPGEIITLVQ